LNKQIKKMNLMVNLVGVLSVEKQLIIIVELREYQYVAINVNN
jgi:hypothetical protein